MNAETITSRQNPLMTHLRKLASSRSYRKKSGEYLCDGTKLLDEALKWGAPVQTAVFSDGVDSPAVTLSKCDSGAVPCHIATPATSRGSPSPCGAPCA